MIKSVVMFPTTLPMKKRSVLIHLDLVYTLSQNPLIGLQEKIAVSITAAPHPETIAVTMFAANLKLGTEKIRRYNDSMESLIDAIALT